MGMLAAPLRGVAALLAVALALGPAVVSGAPPVPVIQALSGLRVWPVSLQGSGPYDALVGSFTANITVGGAFRFRADLLSSGGSLIASNATDLNLAAGSPGIQVAIPGPRIAAAGVDGPYDFRVVAIPVAETGNQTFVPMAATNVTTFAYRAAYFAGYYASIAGPISDRPLDTDSDGLADVLAVEVPLHVSAPGEVLVQGCLECSYLFNPDSLLNESRPLPAGTATWEIRFDGAEIHHMALAYSRALTVWIRLTLGLLGPVADVNYTTALYSGASFVGPSADFMSASPSFAVIDTNRDGFADYLDVNVTVRVRAAGDYWLHMNLQGWAAYAYVDRLIHLDPGVRVLSVPISALLVDRLNLTAGDVQLARFPLSGWDPEYWQYAILTWTAPQTFGMPLASRPVSTLSVYVPNAGGCPVVYALDTTTGFYATGQFGYPGNGTGAAILSLYDGTFDVLATSCGNLSSAVVQPVTVSGPTSVTLTPPAGLPWRWNLTLDVASGNETDVTLAEDFGASGPSMRFLADLEGNLDGTANATEIGRYTRAQSAYAWPVFNGPWFNPLHLLVDGRALPVRSVTVTAPQGTGSIVSAAPLAVNATWVYRSDLPPTVSGPRTLVVDLPYSLDYLRYRLSVRVQGAAASPAWVSSRLFIPPGLLSFNWSANATVTSPGPGGWDIAIGGLPFPDAYGLYCEFRLGPLPAVVWPGPPPSPTPLDPLLILGTVVLVSAVFVAAVVYAFRRRAPPHTGST